MHYSSSISFPRFAATPPNPRPKDTNVQVPRINTQPQMNQPLFTSVVIQNDTKLVHGVPVSSASAVLPGKTTVSTLLAGMPEDIPLFIGRSNHLSAEYIAQDLLEGKAEALVLKNSLAVLTDKGSENDYISRTHGYFIKLDGQIFYRDGVSSDNAQGHRNSKNGSYLWEPHKGTWEKIASETLIPLKAGDQISLTLPKDPNDKGTVITI